ncbi:MAG: hypothetical protein AB7K68_14090 [Bacteriovoracia bacterium]
MKLSFAFFSVWKTLFITCAGWLLLCALYEKTGMGTGFWTQLFAYTWGMPLGALVLFSTAGFIGHFLSSQNSGVEMALVLLPLMLTSYFQWFYLAPLLRKRTAKFFEGKPNLVSFIPLACSPLAVVLAGATGIMFAPFLMAIMFIFLGVAAVIKQGREARAAALTALLSTYVFSAAIACFYVATTTSRSTERFVAILVCGVAGPFAGICLATFTGYWKRRRLASLSRNSGSSPFL